MLTTTNHPLPPQSPFDSIRRFDQGGAEYWSARDLMAWLGYRQWRNAEKAIARAIKSLANQQVDTENHFAEVAQKSKGRDFQDFRLSRLACYTIAMNSDPDKETVAQAQGYFAARTREAEITISAQSEAIRLLELQNENLRLKADRAAWADRLLPIHGKELALTMLGFDAQIVQVERLVTEVVNPETNRSDRILSADQLKRVVQDASGQRVKSMADFVQKLRNAGRDDLVVAVTRNNTNLYPLADRIQEAITVVYGDHRQTLIGEGKGE